MLQLKVKKADPGYYSRLLQLWHALHGFLENVALGNSDKNGRFFFFFAGSGQHG